jgi:hypothetical protein
MHKGHFVFAILLAEKYHVPPSMIEHIRKIFQVKSIN